MTYMQHCAEWMLSGCQYFPPNLVESSLSICISALISSASNRHEVPLAHSTVAWKLRDFY